jgi:hypothetical protein
LVGVRLNANIILLCQQRYHRYCKIWYIIQIVFFVLAVLGLIGTIVNIARGRTSALSLLGYGISLTYRLITLKIIKDFMNEIIDDSKTGRVYQAS